MSDQPISFSLTLEELPVEIDGKSYILQELDGKDRDKYLTSIGSRLRQNAKGEAAGVKNFDGLQASLVAKSLKKIGEDGEKTAVTQDAIQAMPARVVAGLFKEAKKLSKLGDEEKEGEPGND